MARKVGLPGTIRLKHDEHLVDELSRKSRTCVIRYIPMDRISPGAQQPRKDFGDLESLAQSIQEKGVIEPIILRPRNGHFEIIAGERRFRAARLAGLEEIPGIEYDIQDNEALEISIIENIQRKDLNLFEHAFSLKSLNDIYGYTHEEIAQKISTSRVTVSELIRLTDLPADIVSRCQELAIESKTFLLELVKLEDAEIIGRILDEYEKEPFSRDALKAMRKITATETLDKKKTDHPAVQKRRERFKFVAPDKSLKIDFSFKSGEVTREKLITTIEALLEDLRQGRIKNLKI